MKRQGKPLSKVTNPNFITKKVSINSNEANTLAGSEYSTKSILQKIKAARTTSTINISNMSLEVLPCEIFDQNIKFDDINWWEMVDIKKIDAGNNNLTYESFSKSQCDFGALPYLNYLKLSFNKFNAIPDSLFTLSNLKYLDLANNKISIIPDGKLRSLSSLVELNMSNNILGSVPDELKYLVQIEVLNLACNKLVEIPSGIAGLYRLKRLDVSENMIEGIYADSLLNATVLEQLIVFKNRIKVVEADAFTSLCNLQYLDMHSNQLTCLNIAPCVKLDCLILGYNQLAKIENLDSCTKLTILDVNNNKFDFFPEEILLLKELKTLNLQNNSLNEIPPAVCLLKNLVRISLEGNPLKKLSSKVRYGNAEQIKAYLKTRLTETDIEMLHAQGSQGKDIEMDINFNLNLSSESQSSQGMILSYAFNGQLKMNSLGLSEIPYEEIQKYFNSTSLLSVDFSSNKITSVNSFECLVEKFQNIREVKFCDNKIQTFPEFFMDFANLKIIDLKNNLLTSFWVERSFSNGNYISPLEYLDLSINKLQAIPKIIKYFNNLSVLLLSNNNISDASAIYSNYFPVLDTIDIGNNKITSLREKSFKCFPNVKLLNLENNDIKSIPTDICLLFKLNKLNLSGNPIRMMRNNILMGGTKTILEYLRKMHAFDNEDLEYEEAMSQMIKPSTSTSTATPSQQSSCKITEDIEIPSGNPLEEINNEIIQIEAELTTPNLAMFKKNDMKKKLQSLIMKRSKMLKK